MAKREERSRAETIKRKMDIRPIHRLITKKTIIVTPKKSFQSMMGHAADGRLAMKLPIS